MDFVTRIILLSAILGLTACNSGGGSQSLNGNHQGGGNAASEPAFETEQSELDAALVCTPFANPEKPPVLLIHGTFTAGWEQYDWSYGPMLEEMGFDVCMVTYPNRGLSDLQISAEYVVNAIRKVHAESGRKIAMVGHSQGGLMPRWALKWWPSVQPLIEDFVLQAAPNHGTVGEGGNPVSDLWSGSTGMPEAFYQMQGDSNFITALNANDETPGDIDYTTLYTQYDELVQPVEPVPSAALDWGIENPKVRNILLQDVCPGYFADHVTIGITDAVAFSLTLDAILNPGPADIERAGGADLCALLPIVPGIALPPDFLLYMTTALPKSFENGMTDPHFSNEEPELKPYAQNAN